MAEEADFDGKVKLYLAISSHFNQTELKKIVNELGFDPEETMGNGASFRDDKREFILLLERRGRLPEFIEVCRQHKSDFDWQKQSIDFGMRQMEIIEENQCQMILVNHFSINDLQHLCFLLDIQYEYLPGYTKQDKLKQLFVFYKRKRWSLERLADICAYIKPEAFK